MWVLYPLSIAFIVLFAMIINAYQPVAFVMTFYALGLLDMIYLKAWAVLEFLWAECL